jgi:iron complex outermembrane receptor protein
MRLSNSPRHLGKVSLLAPLYRDRIFASLEVQAMSDRLTVRNQTVDGFAVCNLTLFSRELVKGLEASVSLYNLFDTRYSDPVSVDFRQRAIEQDGRSFRAKLTYHF